MFAFAGPAYLVSVGYMDPGNWATDLEGGAKFGYRLLWVLVMSNAMAVLLQTLSARLGIVAGRDLAQACRETYPRPVTYALWGLCEIAKRIACRYNFIDSLVALNGALLVNAAILVVAGTVFFKRGIVVTEIQQAYLLLTPLLGYSAASAAFAIALLCSGQSSTLTGTLAGQIVMEGFLNFRMRPWLRRLVTRSPAICPAAPTIFFAGDASTHHLLLLSHAIPVMQPPFDVL